jgi:hypothetical protein
MYFGTSTIILMIIHVNYYLETIWGPAIPFGALYPLCSHTEKKIVTTIFCIFSLLISNIYPTQ